MSLQTAPEITVLIPVYNGAKHLDEAIESVLNQTFKNFELIIINDGSKDDSQAHLDRYAAQDKRCRVIQRENKGLVETRNELIALSNSEFLAWLDQDDVCYPTRLEKQVVYLKAHPECVAVGSDVLLIDKDGNPICDFFRSKSHEDIDAGNMSGEGSQICNPSVSFRKSVAVALGGIRKSFVYAEDIDLFLRMAEVGKLAIIPEVLVKYRQHLEAAGYSNLRVIQIQSAQAAINEARTRRQLPLLNTAEIDSMVLNQHAWEIYAKWAWWALGDRHYKTAIKYAFKALFNQPNLQTFKLALCAIRGWMIGQARA